MNFNSIQPKILNVDINSCFATVEQQANPFLRNKPVAVAAYTTGSGCVLAASVTAKKLGVKTGMRVSDGKKIIPGLIVVPPDPHKYRYVHKGIKRILKSMCPYVFPKSIDEFLVNFSQQDYVSDMKEVGLKIKQRIKDEVGEYITVSIGIGPNRYLAKIASNIKKPDGLEEINKDNYLEVYSRQKLLKLTGIKEANARRLRLIGVKNTLDFYNAPIWKLKLAFGGIGGLYWYLRLRGYEIDDFKSVRKTYGNSYAPPPQKAGKVLEILSKLCQKTGFRLRKAGLSAQGIHLSIFFRDGTYWHKGLKTKRMIFESGDIYKEAVKLLSEAPSESLPRVIAVNVFNLMSLSNLQLNFFDNLERKYSLAKSMDEINKKWGDYTIYLARMSRDPQVVQDRIAFGQSEVI